MEHGVYVVSFEYGELKQFHHVLVLQLILFLEYFVCDGLIFFENGTLALGELMAVLAFMEPMMDLDQVAVV